MNHQNKKQSTSTEEKIFWLCLCGAFCLSICFIALKGRKYLDSDMSSEMILANLLNQEAESFQKTGTILQNFVCFACSPFIESVCCCSRMIGMRRV